MGRYEEVGCDIGRLVDKKNEAYGSSFADAGKILRVLYPSGIPVEAMDDALAITRVVDKFFRLARAAGKADPMGESPWRDIAGYGLLGAERALAKPPREGWLRADVDKVHPSEPK